MADLIIEVRNNTPELMQKVEAAVSNFLVKGVAHIEQELKSSMAEPKSGREYKRGGGRVHVASAPDESPAYDYGDYDNSIQLLLKNSLEAKVGTPLDYPLYLEDGTAQIEPRPLWERTATEVLPTLETMLTDEIRKAAVKRT